MSLKQHLVILIRNIKPQPKVLSREEIERRGLWRSIMLQGEIGDGSHKWSDQAEAENLRHSTEYCAPEGALNQRLEVFH